ncbi:AAA family ATPase [Microvirga aerophila]|uniref:Transcriptional regulator n=1 Tax=Microvirga aerophila TaxID=670291 RepID=A0A512BYI1_9HYPH|nr:CtpF protein [Microvirga aerophila]GEO16897.1 transcriptional regulator [Microvirga aerophila]
MTNMVTSMPNERLRLVAPDPETLVSSAPPSLAGTEDVPHGPLRPREVARVPRINIQAFYESADFAATLESAASDRLMSGAAATIHAGGIAAAIELYKQVPTPNLVLIETMSATQDFLAELDTLAEVCDAGTRLMVVGHVNDITIYRELIGRGVSEYVLAPVEPIQLVAAISGIYRDTTAAKVGKVYAFIGAKGGVGSSTVAHNVSWTIGRRLKSGVAIIDMDLPFGTAGLNFNLDTGQGVSDALQDASRLDQVLFDRLLTSCGDHLSLLAAPAVLDRTFDLDPGALGALLNVAQSSVPFTVLDMPHLWTTWSKDLLLTVDEVVITATPDLASLRNAKNLVAFLKQTRPNDPPPKLILNQIGVPKRPEIKIQDFAKAVQLEPTACIRFEPQLFGNAANKGQMVAEIAGKAAASKGFAELAGTLTGRLESKRGRGATGLGTLLQKLTRK